MEQCGIHKRKPRTSAVRLRALVLITWLEALHSITVKLQAKWSKHQKSRESALALIWKNGIKVRVKNLRPAGHTGRAQILFWKAAFPQSGPAVSEKA